MGKKEHTLTDRRSTKPSSTFPSKKFGAGDKKFVGGKFGGDKKFGDKKFGDKKFGDKKFGDKKFGDNKFGDKKFGDNKFGGLKKTGPRGLKNQMRAALESKTSPQEVKKLSRQDYKSQHKHADVISTLNKIPVANLREKNFEERKATAATIISKANDLVSQLVCRKSSNRILLIAMKFAAPELRTTVIQQITPALQTIAFSPYGHKFLLRLATYSNDVQRQLLLEGLFRFVPALATSPFGAPLLDYLFETASKQSQYKVLRALIDRKFAKTQDHIATQISLPHHRDAQQELRQKLIAEFSAAQPAIAEIINYTEDQIAAEPQHLLLWLIAQEPENRINIIDHIEILLQRATDKQVLMFRFFHPIIAQYMEAVPFSMGSKRDLVAQMVANPLALHHTQEGSLACWEMLHVSTLKTRKAALRHIKGRILELSLHSSGYLIILGFLSTIDDTVFLKKFLLNEFIHTTETTDTAPPLIQLLTSGTGRRILTYIFNTFPHSDTVDLTVPENIAEVFPAYIFTPLERKMFVPRFIPAYLLALDKQRETVQEREKVEDAEFQNKMVEQGNEKDAKLVQGSNDLTDKQYAKESKALEESRLEKKRQDLLDSKLAAIDGKLDTTPVCTVKRPYIDKAYDLAAFLLPYVTKAVLTTTPHQAFGLNAQGTLARHNMFDDMKDDKNDAGSSSDDSSDSDSGSDSDSDSEEENNDDEKVDEEKVGEDQVDDDEDNEEEQEDDKRRAEIDDALDNVQATPEDAERQESTQNQIEQQRSLQFSDKLDKLPQHSVLAAIVKHRVGMDSLFYVLASASLRSFSPENEQQIPDNLRATHTKYNKQYAEAFSDVQQVLDQLVAFVSQFGEDVCSINTFDANKTKIEFLREQRENLVNITANGLDFGDNTFVLVQGKSHLFYKKLLAGPAASASIDSPLSSATGLLPQHATAFAEQIWATLQPLAESDAALFNVLSEQNRFGFVMSSLVAHRAQLAANVKDFVLGHKLYTKTAIAAAVKSARAEQKVIAVAKKGKKQLAVGLDVFFVAMEQAANGQDDVEAEPVAATQIDVAEPTPEPEPESEPAGKKRRRRKAASNEEDVVVQLPQISADKEIVSQPTENSIAPVGLHLDLGDLSVEPEPVELAEGQLTPRRSARLASKTTEDIEPLSLNTKPTKTKSASKKAKAVAETEQQDEVVSQEQEETPAPPKRRSRRTAAK